MLNLYQIYEKFLIFFKKSNPKKQKDDEHTASLFFGLLEKDKNSVDIKCIFPNVTNKSIDEISAIAEKYAQLLVLLNTEQFNQNILEILNKHKSANQDNYKAIMLIDNIVSFWDMFYNMQNKKFYQQYKTNQPMIKPSEAFKIK